MKPTFSSRLAGILFGTALLGWSWLAMAAPAPSPAPITHHVEMRDGTRLATDVYLPEGSGPWPVIFLRFPYNKNLGVGAGADATKRGFAFVSQDTRGRFASRGENLPFDADGQAGGKWDGYDSAEWIARQGWCNGRIGTFGGSAGGITQYFLAGTGQTNVISQHVTVGTPSLFLDGMYRGGVFRKSLVEDWFKATRFESYALDLWTTNYPYTPYWKEREITHRYGNSRAAAVHIGGWFDIFAQGTVDAFAGYQKHGGPGARGRQKLIMGPWTHGVLQEKAGELQFPDAKKAPLNLHDPWKWFAATLKDETNGFLEAPAVTYYVMGASGEPGAPGNVWRTADQWPPVRTSKVRLHLAADRKASWKRSFRSSLTYISDPENPVPTVGGYELTLPAGPRDQRSIESRPDVVVFTSDVLEKPLEIAGNVDARITLHSSTPDADLFVRLCDVYPDGRSVNICDGILRLRFRNGLEREQLLQPGETVTADVQLWPTSMIFNKGHRLRVHVASSSVPAMDLNLQNGGSRKSGSPRRAEISLQLGGNDSYLDLPVVRSK